MNGKAATADLDFSFLTTHTPPIVFLKSMAGSKWSSGRAASHWQQNGT